MLYHGANFGLDAVLAPVFSLERPVAAALGLRTVLCQSGKFRQNTMLACIGRYQHLG
jgi:hypothetical protein